MTAAPWLGRVLAATLGALAAAAGAAAQPTAERDEEPTAERDEEPTAERDEEPTTAPAARSGREYGGVVPGRAGAVPPGARGGKPPARPTVTWVGFQALPGRALVFLQLSADAPYEQEVVGDALVVRIPGVRLDLENHARPLDTRFFPGDVARVAARAVRLPAAGDRRARKGTRGVELRVTFKDGATARRAVARIETAADGYRYLYLELPDAEG